MFFRKMKIVSEGFEDAVIFNSVDLLNHGMYDSMGIKPSDKMEMVGENNILFDHHIKGALKFCKENKATRMAEFMSKALQAVKKYGHVLIYCDRECYESNQKAWCVSDIDSERTATPSGDIELEFVADWSDKFETNN